MGHSFTKVNGCLNKRRFSLKYPDGKIERYGSCDPKDDDRRNVSDGNGGFYLIHLNKDASLPPIGSEKLPEGTLWTNGYYDSEHDGWKDLILFVI